MEPETKQILLQVLVATLAVIGFCGILQGLLGALLVPRELGTAVILTQPLSPAELDILLCEARHAPLGRGKRVALVLEPALLRGALGENGRLAEEYAEIAEKYGVPVCVVTDTHHP